MNKKAIKPNVDLVIAKFAIFGILAILFTILSVNGVTPWFLWVLMLIGVFSIFSAAIEAENGLYKSKLSFYTINQLKQIVNEQQKIINKHDQTLERMLEFKKRVKDHVISIRSEYDLWSNEEIPQIEAQLDHLDDLIEANSQKCDCTDIPAFTKNYYRLIACHKCGKEHLM